MLLSPRTPTSVYRDGKSLFRRCSTPTKLVGRSIERQMLTEFWNNHILTGKPGSLYISGIPGTGKTALLDEVISGVKSRRMKVLENYNFKFNFRFVYYF